MNSFIESELMEPNSIPCAVFDHNIFTPSLWISAVSVAQTAACAHTHTHARVCAEGAGGKKKKKKKRRRELETALMCNRIPYLVFYQNILSLSSES